MAMTPSSEPTDRSMFRETMTSTMPVAMIATGATWTENVTMLVGVRILPPVTMPKPMQDASQREEHAEEAQVDLSRCKEAAHRRARSPWSPGQVWRRRCQPWVRSCPHE